MSGNRVPTSTYRVQLNLQFRFTDATALVPYLHDLGITDLYISPRFKARKGSSHGYDVADPQRISSELGTEEEFEELVSRLKHYGMGLLLDIVPNHMAASWENPWWRDVLENGPSSLYAHYFDIDWHPATTKAAFLQENKVLLPVLGDLYGNVLENQELSLKVDENGFFVGYYEHRLPLDPGTYRFILEPVVEAATAAGLPENVIAQFAQLAAASAALPLYTSMEQHDRQRRLESAQGIKQQLWSLLRQSPEVSRLMEKVLSRLNGRREEPGSFQTLDELLARQPYRLAHWKIGMEEINYRRFFDVNELVGLRVQDPQVFVQRHRMIAQLAREQKITGVRVDHVDGLFDPRGYLEMLQSTLSEGQGGPDRFFVVVEKVLGEAETLPREWPVSGTTGYDYLNYANALFVHADGLAALEEIYAGFTGNRTTFSDVCYAGNKKVMQTLFSGEVHALSHHLARLAAQNRRARDLPLYELVQLLIEVTACLPVYRTYIRETTVSDRDRVLIERALTLARRRTPAGQVSDSALAFLRRVLFLDPPFYDPHQDKDFLEFVTRWQQFTGPVMAKGLEDTAAYVHSCLISLNEVGEDPLREQLPLDVDAFHLFNRQRREEWPHTMNATSTHDTKRSEDVRARINVLSEVPEQWKACLTRWSRWNTRHRRTVEGQTVPSPSEEVLIYQTLLGAWPLHSSEMPGLLPRMKTYMQKAAREAKVHTNWIQPSEAHESALAGFVEGILESATQNRFLADFPRFQKVTAFHGALNSLSQVLLKIAAPGLPDIYQGNELWDFSLVDPDNRRPVDFPARVRMLEAIRNRPEDAARDFSDLLQAWPDGRVKLFATWKALAFRGANASLFQEGDYVPLDVSGRLGENVCAFARRLQGNWAIVVVPRFTTQLVETGHWPLGSDVWGQTSVHLPAKAPLEWRNVMTEEIVVPQPTPRARQLRLAAIFRSFPVALLAATNAHFSH